jgi:PKHD-type hydroxylase
MKNKKKKELKNQSSVWPFEIDILETWAHWSPVFTPEECKKIIDIGNKKGLIESKIIESNNTDEKNLKIRKSSISWLHPGDDLEWAFIKLTDVITSLNKDYFKFDLYGFIEGFQFTHYKAPGDNYKKHVDKCKDRIIRKLSLSIQLSDPSSYEGGELVLYVGEEGITVPKEQGKLIAFPSFTLHEVKPVTKGERYSLVAWITGPQFK